MATVSFYVGGARTSSKNVWKVEDDGSTLTVTDSWDIQSANIIRAIVKDLDGNFYIAAGNWACKYSSAMVIDTTWATSGIYNAGKTIGSLAVDAAGYLAIAASGAGSDAWLLDEDGTLVWNGALYSNGQVSFDGAGNVYTSGGGTTSGAHACNKIRRAAPYSVLVNYLNASGTHSGGSALVLPDNTVITVRNATAANSTWMYIRENDGTVIKDGDTANTTIGDLQAIFFPSDSDAYTDLFYGFGTNSGTKTLYKLQYVVGTGITVLASYDINNTGSENHQLHFDANGNIVVGSNSTADEDGNTTVLRVFNTDLTLLRYYTGAALGTIYAVSCGVSARIMPQAPVAAYKTYSRALVGIANNEVWHDTTTSGTMAELTAANGDFDVTKPLDAFELDEKIFIANKTNLKVADFGNVKLQTDDIQDTVAGATSYPLRKVIITGAGGAEMVIDYITATNGAAYIYGTKLNSTAFVDGELVSGTNSDGTTIKFDIKAGTTEVNPPHWYNWTVYGGSSTYGAMPAEATIGCNWNGRACLAGNAYYPHQWYMFEQMNPWNLNWVALDAQAPVIGNDADAGETGDLLVALIPYKDDFLIHGCAGSLWYNVGDPASGGSLLELSLTAGILGRDAFCWDKNDNLYILGTTGILRIPKGFGAPENLTEEMYPDFIKDLGFNSSLHKISMGYDPHRHGIKIYRTTIADGNNTGWWFDLRKQGLFPESVPTAVAPYCMFYYNSVDPAYTGLLSGCTDGLIRAEDDDAEDDDVGVTDSAINSYITFGPLKLGGEEQEGILNSITGITTGGSSGSDLANSGDLTFRVWTELSSDAVVEKFISNTSPRLAGTFAAPGRERGARRSRPVRGMYAGVRVGNNTAGETWGLEHLIINGGPSGKVT
jgi:hypothetical protein